MASLLRSAFSSLTRNWGRVRMQGWGVHSTPAPSCEMHTTGSAGLRGVAPSDPGRQTLYPRAFAAHYLSVDTLSHPPCGPKSSPSHKAQIAGHLLSSLGPSQLKEGPLLKAFLSRPPWR